MNPLLLFGINLGATLGESFLKNPATQKLVQDAVTGTEILIMTLTGKNAGDVKPQLFIDALSLSLNLLLDSGKLDANTAAALQDALSKTLAADAAAQQTVDANALKPIEPLA